MPNRLASIIRQAIDRDTQKVLRENPGAGLVKITDLEITPELLEFWRERYNMSPEQLERYRQRTEALIERAKNLPPPGCTPAEIEQLKAAHKVSFLPAEYEGLLLEIGHALQEIFPGDEIIGYPGLLKARQRAEELIAYASSKKPFKLPDGAFVFFHYDDIICFFHTAQREEFPVIYEYSGGYYRSTLSRRWDNLAEFFDYKTRADWLPEEMTDEENRVFLPAPEDEL